MTSLRDIDTTDTVWIFLSDGTRLAARLWLPKDADQNPVPAILEYLPYRRRDGTLPRDEITHPYLAQRGYACVRVDIRGTGDSNGLLQDEYHPQEQADALEIIRWLTQQPWCDGHVGMIGISWGGFNGLQVAAHAPEALKAVITLCSTDDRYADDIHYKGGALLNENLGWASTMMAYQSRPPDPEVVGEAWYDMWLERLENLPAFIEPWLQHQQRDAYWQHGSICEAYTRIQAAVLAVGGWHDAYSNAIFRMVRHLDAPVRAIIGPWAHKYPHFAVPLPQIGFLQECLRWFDYWLKGQETHIMAEPLIRAYVMRSHREQGYIGELTGHWVGLGHWPQTGQTYHLTQHHTLMASHCVPADEDVSLSLASPEDTGSQAGEYCVIWLGPEWPLEQRPDDRRSLYFDYELPEDLEIIGAPVLKLNIISDKPQANLIARLCDVHPDGHSTRITYGVLNLTQRMGPHTPCDLPVGEPVAITLTLDDVAYYIPKGHTLRLALSSAYWPLIWPSQERVTVQVLMQNAVLTVPHISEHQSRMPVHFLSPEQAPAADIETLRPSTHTRIHQQDAASGLSHTHIRDDFGRQHIRRYDLITDEQAEEHYHIHPYDPSCARLHTHWREELKRADWEVVTEHQACMWVSEAGFELELSLEASLRGQHVYKRQWRFTVPRHYL